MNTAVFFVTKNVRDKCYKMVMTRMDTPKSENRWEIGTCFCILRNPY